MRVVVFQWLSETPNTILIRLRRLIMTNREYNLWTLTELRQDDPRNYLDVIIQNAKFDKVQAIQYQDQYQDDTVFVISESQYKKLMNS